MIRSRAKASAAESAMINASFSVGLKCDGSRKVMPRSGATLFAARQAQAPLSRAGRPGEAGKGCARPFGGMESPRAWARCGEKRRLDGSTTRPGRAGRQARRGQPPAPFGSRCGGAEQKTDISPRLAETGRARPSGRTKRPPGAHKRTNQEQRLRRSHRAGMARQAGPKGRAAS